MIRRLLGPWRSMLCYYTDRKYRQESPIGIGISPNTGGNYNYTAAGNFFPIHSLVSAEAYL